MNLNFNYEDRMASSIILIAGHTKQKNNLQNEPCSKDITNGLSSPNSNINANSSNTRSSDTQY